MPATCCIIGGGPAGIMLGLLLARAGVPVTVLEKHTDFFRDFRGDTIHPSTLELLHELGLLEKFLALPHSQITGASVHIGDQQLQIADFSHLPTQCKFIALMPQWDFLNFLAAEARTYPNFTLRMGCEATGLLYTTTSGHGHAIPTGLQVTGVRANTPDGPVDIPATLTIGCDGRSAISRASAHLPLHNYGVPIDVLWFRLPRQPTDPENVLGYVNFGRMLGLLNRITYFQTAYIIAKDSFPAIQQEGLPAFRASIGRLAPFLAGRTSTIQSWDDVKLLTVQVNRLQQWALPGLLCIGDAAHAMSPVGGIGINIALQDAVATANRLAEPLLADTVTIHDLNGIQQYRESAVHRTQRFQTFAHRMLNRVLGNPGPIRPPLILRLLSKIPAFRHRTGRFIGLGLQPQHIQTPDIHAEKPLASQEVESETR